MSNDANANQSPSPKVVRSVGYNLLAGLSHEDLIGETYERMLKEQPVLTKQITGYSEKAARDETEGLRMREAMALTYQILEDLAPADQYQLPRVEPSINHVIEADLRNEDLIGETYERLLAEQPALTNQVETYILKTARDETEQISMIEATAFTFLMLEAQAQADQLDAQVYGPSSLPPSEQ